MKIRRKGVDTVWLGLVLPFLGTALGAGAALGLPRASKTGSSVLAGAAGGMMLAASMWSLLLPAVEAEPIAALGGFVLGMLLLLLPERFPMEAFGPETALITAVVLHNIPEGMAVGAGYAAGDAATVTWGIALQNIPDGAVAAVPLLLLGMNRRRAFSVGVLTGAVEPLAALVMLWAAPVLSGWLPGCMGFAGGAMLYVVLRELAPRMGDSGWGAAAFAAGFVLMAG